MFRTLLRYALLLVCLLAVSTSFAQKKLSEDWQPITPQDLQIKEVPGDPGADAIQLYYADYINDEAHHEFFYDRIKVLNDKGRDKYANVEIPVYPQRSISGLKARTIHPDGSIVEFTGKPFDKVIVKGQGVKVTAKTFTMPEVTVGSIIEYKYNMDPDDQVLFLQNEWLVQQPLYTVKEHFAITPYRGAVEDIGNVGLSYTTLFLPQKPVRNGERLELELSDMPAFHTEEMMPPEDNYKAQVRFYYGGGEVETPEKFWQRAGRKWNDDAEHFIGNHSEVRAVAGEAVGSDTDPDQKLRKLYARAQQIRNLSYERERTQDEMKKEKLKPNNNVADVLKQGFGYRTEINRLFAAMARTQGFQPAILRVSDRSDRFFDKAFLSRDQLDAEVVQINVNGKDMYFSPGTKYCPYGMLPWNRSATPALKLDNKGGTLMQIPGAGYDQAVTERVANVALSPDGSLQGTIAVKFMGQDALQHRLDAIETDEAGRNKDLENELRRTLPGGAVVKLTASSGWDTNQDPLVANFTVSIQGFATGAGKRVLVPAYLFQGQNKNAFTHPDRKFPVYIPYAFKEYDRVNMTMPQGFTVDSIPERQTVQLPYAAYQSVAQLAGPVLVTERVLLDNGVFVEPAHYTELKNFFNKVEAGDELQAVLKVGGSTNAQASK